MQETADALKPIFSLISKCEKAIQKVAPGTWQHSMLETNLKALHIAHALMKEGPRITARFTQNELDDARLSMASMIAKTVEAQAKFASGTSQHTLLRNRLSALKVALALIN